MSPFETIKHSLEAVLADELRAKVDDAARIDVSRGRVTFEAARPPNHLLVLRTADNLYALVAGLTVGRTRSALVDLERVIARTDLSEPLTAAFPAGAPASATFVVNAARAGDHTYSRFEAAAAAERGIAAQRHRWRTGSADRHDIEFRLDLVGDVAWFSLRLTGPDYRFRGAGRASVPGALRPSAAHGLVWLTRPSPADVFLDPFCGTGTLAAERACYPNRRVIAADREEMPRAPNTPALFDVLRADARAMPLVASSVDAVATNLPWGRQVLTSSVLPDLYRAFLQELARVLRRAGRAALLTEHERLLREAMPQSLRVAATIRLSIRGVTPAVCLVEKDSDGGT
jgi:23S rRNA G2445 N2-methylase RlmL